MAIIHLRRGGCNDLYDWVTAARNVCKWHLGNGAEEFEACGDAETRANRTLAANQRLLKSGVAEKDEP